MNKWRKTVAVSIAGAMFAGCGAGDRAATDEVAVSVNGETLMQSQIDDDVAKVLDAQKAMIPAEQIDYAKKMVANQLVQSFISSKVLVAKAKSEGLEVTDADMKEREAEFMKAVAGRPDAPKSIEEQFKKFPLGEKRARDEFINGILIDKLIKAHAAKADNATVAASEAAALKKIKELKATLDALAKDEKALAKKFAELAKENSDCPSSAKGGDLGEFGHGQMVKEFDEAAFALPVGKVSEPVKTQFGYHLVMTTAKTPAVEAKDGKAAEPEKVRASHILIKVKTAKQVEREFVRDFVMDEIKKADIKASETYKQFLPQKDEGASETPKSEAQVENKSAK